MEVQRKVHIVTDRVAQRGAAVEHLLYLLVGVDVVQLLGGVHLHGRVALVALFAHGRRHVVRSVAANPAVYPQAVAAQPAQQFVHRHAQRAPLDVPQRLVDARDGAHDLRPATVKACAIHRLPQVLNAPRVFAQEVIAQLLHGSRDGVCASFNDRLAPTAEALVRLQLQKQPARRRRIEPEARDLHDSILPMWFFLL